MVRELNKEVSNLSSHQKCQKSGKCSTKKGKNQENILHGKLGKINMVKIQALLRQKIETLFSTKTKNRNELVYRINKWVKVL